MLDVKVDLYFDSTMYGHMIFQPIIYIVLGMLLQRKIKLNLHLFNSFGVSGLIVFISNYIFWMLPSALDLTLISNVLDKISHLCYLCSGMLLFDSMKKMIFFVRATFGIKFLAMLSAVGTFYCVYEDQACTSYSLIQQKETGFILLLFVFPLWILHLIWIFMKYSRDL